MMVALDRLDRIDRTDGFDRFDRFVASDHADGGASSAGGALRKSMRRWEPSQNGLRPEAPQRQSVALIA